MSEWWRYEPADFLLFSPRVYYRMIELHNEALWPAQLVAFAVGLAILAMTARGGAGGRRTAGVLLGALWVWVAWSFLWERYAVINWAAAYVAPIFVAQGVALGLCAVRADAATPVTQGCLRWAGIALLAGAALLYPLIAPWLGRPWSAAELLGLMPDPTAIATIAYLALVRQGAWLMCVPVLWCALSSETLWLLHTPDFFIPGVGAFSGIVLRVAHGLCSSQVELSSERSK